MNNFIEFEINNLILKKFDLYFYHQRKRNEQLNKN